MKIEFVNHASVLIEFEGIRLLTDPWYKGIVVNNGWSLLTPSKFQLSDFDSISHIWFSHEHSDHFVPQLLKEIPIETRKKITILFQHTEDKKIIKFCHDKLEFGNVIELLPGESIYLSKNFKFRCDPYHSGDSWFHIQLSDFSILNINDCMVRSIEEATEIHKKIGKVDLLMSQFGYAHKIGNEHCSNLRKEAASEKLQRLENQLSIFKPKFLLPFASFSIFCHDENFYMNKEQVKVGDVHNHLSPLYPETNVIVLFPGDIWKIGEDYSSALSLSKYEKAYGNLEHFPRIKTKTIDWITLQENARSYGQRMIEKNPSAKKLINKIGTLFFISDLSIAVRFKGIKGFEPVRCAKDYCDVSISSDSLNYMLLHEWGGMTCVGNARYFTTKFGDIYKFDLLVRIADLNNQGKEFIWEQPSYLQRLKHRLFKGIFLLIAAKT